MKNLKKIVFKNKTIITLLVLVAFLAVAVFFYIDKKTNSVVNENQNPSQNENIQNTDEEIANNVANKKVPEETTTTGDNQATPQSSNATDIAKSVSLQGVMDMDTQQAIISLYGMSAYYTVEKEVDGAWMPLKTNVFYSGRNGLEVDNLQSNSSSLEYIYRVYPVIDGVKSNLYNEVVVNWNLLVSEKVKSFVGSL